MQDVVEVFDLARKEIPAKLLMIGDGPDRHKIEELCREKGMEDEVRFLGKQEMVEEILSISDLFVMPSETESFGLAALEAMACQVPVISSDSGGMPELNINGVTGFMSKVGDVKEMAKNALFILNDDAVLAKFRVAALARAKEFDIHQIMPMYERYYQRIIEKTLSSK